MTGCTDGEIPSTTEAESDLSTSAVPTYAEVSAAVPLDDADASAVKGALAEWRKSVEERGIEQRAAPRHAQMQFIAGVAPSLDDAQLSELVDFLAARNEARREEMGARFAGREHGPGRGMAKLAEALGLSDEQQAAMKALHEETRAKAEEQHDALRAGTVTRAQLHDAMKALHDAQREKMTGILTTDQVARLGTLHDEREDSRIDHRLGHVRERTEEHAAWLDAVLDLSDAQVARVKTALRTFAEAQKSALEARRGDSATRAQLHERMSTAHDALAAAFEEILTEEQQARLEIVHRLHPRGPHRM
jgi:hypothetical protein